MTTRLTPRALVAALADGQAVSGAELARRMGVTRAAIWKQLAALREQGLPITAQAGQGYRLPWPIQLLDADRIHALLPKTWRGDVHIAWSVPSTQAALVRHVDTWPDMSVLLAETQTAGRGRRGRRWQSPPGCNLALTCGKRFEHGFAAVSGLSLAVGVMLVEALGEAGVEGLHLKWPNDVLTAQGKLAGVLIEMRGEYQGPCHAVIGVGMNVQLPESVRARIDQPGAALVDLMPEPPSRNALAACLIAQLRAGLARFEREGFAAFVDAFARLDGLRGRPLVVRGPDGEVCGRGAGINGHGALLLQTAHDVIEIAGGNVSVRAAASPGG